MIIVVDSGVLIQKTGGRDVALMSLPRHRCPGSALAAQKVIIIQVPFTTTA